MQELANSSDELLRRLADASSANSELRQQLEAQARDLASLESWGRARQQQLQDFNRQVAKGRRSEAAAATAAAAVAAAAQEDAARRESRLRGGLEEFREQSKRDQADLLERIRVCDHERVLRASERDEARARVVELEHQLEVAMAGAAAGAPRNVASDATTSAAVAPAAVGAAGWVSTLACAQPDSSASAADGSLAAPEPRVAALEMELILARSRFAQEVRAREAAEQAAAQARQERQQLRTALERFANETRQLRLALAEQSELVAFRQELCQDLQQRLQRQQQEAAERLRWERSRFETVTRLEGILPKSLILRALA